jgi:hypothetical protein
MIVTRPTLPIEGVHLIVPIGFEVVAWVSFEPSSGIIEDMDVSGGEGVMTDRMKCFDIGSYLKELANASLEKLTRRSRYPMETPERVSIR